MGGEASATVSDRSEALEQQGFAGAHARKIEPSMVGAELEQINFVFDACHGRDEIVRAQALRVTHGQWGISHRTFDRPPDVDHGEAARRRVSESPPNSWTRPPSDASAR
jgi:hypothetical protein